MLSCWFYLYSRNKNNSNKKMIYDINDNNNTEQNEWG